MRQTIIITLVIALSGCAMTPAESKRNNEILIYSILQMIPAP